MNTSNSGIIETAKDKTITAVKGTENIVEKTVNGATQIVTTTVKDIAKVGGEIETDATGLVKGAVEGVKEMAVKTEQGTAAVAVGAVKAVGAVGTAVVDRVHHTPAKPVTSDKDGMAAPKT